MVVTYNIYIVNQSLGTEIFWCFLARPEALADDSGVYANSSASLKVAHDSREPGRFAIPLRYVIGAGISRHKVQFFAPIVSDVTHEASLRDIWSVGYQPDQSITLRRRYEPGPENVISISTDEFDQVKDENAGWFANQSFGIETSAGFIGMSWSPSSPQTRRLTPKLSFTIAAGNFEANRLLRWDEISIQSVPINAPYDFLHEECTITYARDGTWIKTPGKPRSGALAGNLL